MRRTLYDSRSIPLDVLFNLAAAPRGMFGEAAPVLAETHDAPRPADTDDTEEN